MRPLLVAILTLTWAWIAGAQAVPVDVQFKLLGMKDNYDVDLAPLAGETVRLVLGEKPDWQSPAAGRKFVTDAKGEAHFTMDALIDTRWRSRNIGLTPFSKPAKADHLKIAVELQHTFPLEKDGPLKNFRWLLTMDLDCFHDGPCSTVGFMEIYPPDAQGRFTRPLARQADTESWKVPELNGKVIWGMSYQVADFMLSADENDPKKRTLRFAIKRLPQAVSR